MRRDDGAHSGRGRREPPPKGLRAGGGEALRPAGLAAAGGRGSDRRGPDGNHVRLSAVRHPAGRADLRQGHRRRTALRRIHDQ